MAFAISSQGSTCSTSAVTLGRSQYPKHDLIHLLPISKHNLGPSSAALRLQHGSRRKMNFVVFSGEQQGAPPPSDSFSGSRMKIWILGAIMTVLLSFTKGKWGPLLKLKEEFKERIDEIEDAVDTVEGAAEKVDKVAEGISDNLPAGKLRDFADFIENVAEQVDKGAELAEDALEKVEEAGEELETLFESKTGQEKTEVAVAAAATEGKDQK